MTTADQPSTRYPPGDDCAQLYYDVASVRFSTQMASIDALDSKAVAMFSTGSAVIALAMTVTAVRDDAWTAPVAWLMSLAVAATLALGGLTIAAIRPRPWKVFPSPEDAWKVMWTRPGEGRWAVAIAAREAWSRNKKPVDTKIDLLRCSLYALMAETTFAVAALAIIAAS